jgi:hypothetical protein
MSIIGSNILAGASGQAGGGGAYEISRSVRFNSSDSAYLSKGYTTSGSRRKATISIWCKRSKLGDNGGLFLVSDGSSSTFTFIFKSDDKIQVYWNNGAANLSTASVFRDLSAWYHFVLVVDTDNATASDRAVVYVNGVRNTLSGTFPTQGSDTELGLTGSWVHTIGMHMAGVFKLNGYLADIHFIDGQALTPSSFGEFDTNGVWQPIDYAGTFGTNGFHLPFSDNSTAAALGTDTSSNGNTWTVNNISVTAGVGNDSLVDSPTNYGTDTGAGGEVRGNYCTLNPLDNGGLTLANGNLDSSRATASWVSCRATIGITSGKWYWEISGTGTYDASNGPLVGISKGTATLASYPGNDANGWGYYSADGQKYTAASGSSYGASWTGSDVIGVAFDADNGTLTFYKNNATQGTAFTGLTSGPYFPAVGIYGTASCFANFGQRPFAYTAPSGFKALCTTNLPEPTIADGSTVMDVLTWTGNGASSRSLTGLNFSPDFAWIKLRNSAAAHTLWDSVRGLGSTKELSSSDTAAEGTTVEAVNYGYVSALDSNGLTVNVGTINANYVNTNSNTYVAWTWDAGSSTVTNTQGSISSQVRTNGYLSIVTYTGTGSNATVGHGLGVAPQMLIVKSRSNAENWCVYHQSVGNTAFLKLDTTGGSASFNAWASTTPTSTVFSVGNIGETNTNGGTYVCYAFAPVAGYSSFGSYTGNGSADGPMVWTGFRPRFLLWKRSDSTGDWIIFDSARDTYNYAEKQLLPNSSSAEVVTGGGFVRIDFLSNGFKIRSTDSYVNANGGTYVYFAVAENPFAYSRAR